MDLSLATRGRQETDDVDSKDFYTVKAVHNKKMLRGRWWYEVEWKDWPHTTWEPVKNVEHTDGAKAFERKLKAGEYSKQIRKFRVTARAPPVPSTSTTTIATTASPPTAHQESSNYYFNSEKVNDKMQTQLKGLKPITPEKMCRLLNCGTRVTSILGMEKTSEDYFVRYGDNSYERIPKHKLQFFEMEKLVDFLSTAMRKLKNH